MKRNNLLKTFKIQRVIFNGFNETNLIVLLKTEAIRFQISCEYQKLGRRLIWINTTDNSPEFCLFKLMSVEINCLLKSYKALLFSPVGTLYW
jgi:hypothetical protein